MAEGQSSNEVVRQDAILVEKSQASRFSGFYDQRVRIDIENESTERVVVDITERFPTGCQLSSIKGTNNESLTWHKNLNRRKLRVRVELDPKQRTTIKYAPLDCDSTAFDKLLDRPPEVSVVEQLGDGHSIRDPTGDASASGSCRRSPPSHKIVSHDHEYLDPPPSIDFSNVAGMYEVKEELENEIVVPFTDPRFDEYDIGKANGVLFFGPPGTGKTHIATALAGELGYNFLEVDVGSLRDSEFGGTQENIAELFEMAETNQPCVVFFDELDSIAPQRGSRLHQGRAESVNQLLRYVGDINERDADVVIIGATNRPDQIDDALKRTGRFDTRIKIGMPDPMTRLAILEHELESFDGSVGPFWTDQEFVDTFVDSTANFASSDIIETVDSAKRASLRRTNRGEEPRITREILLDQVGDMTNKQEADTAGEFLTETPNIDFSDVGGMAETKERLEKTLLEPLSKPDMYEQYRLDIPNGILLYGPPGTGKTYISRALAGEADSSFLSITASDIVSKWVGEAAQNIQDLFEKARDVAPAIVFIDEIDAIASSRDGGVSMSNTEEQAVNELLAQISDLNEQDVFVIGTTNRPDIIDNALTRSGRLGEKIEIPPPGKIARIEILKKQLENRPFDEEQVDWDTVANLTETDRRSEPYVASDLAKIADEAARNAMDEASASDIQPITQQHLEVAISETEPSLSDIDI